MAFRVVESYDTPGAPREILLVKDNWNDWYVWHTQFFAIVIADNGARITVGQVKIGRVGMHPQDNWTNLPDTFPALGEGWYSIGQSENYYETLEGLGSDFREWYLRAIRDCAFDLTILTQHEEEEVLRRSLLRDIEWDRVRNRFHRLASGNAVLTPFAFRYAFPPPKDPNYLPPELDFFVTPGSHPPTNIHVLIGRNGVGKTRCFDFLSRTFLGLSSPEKTFLGTLRSLEVGTSEHGFAGLVTVSFSPFDEYGPLVSSTTGLGVRYAYVGLIREAALRAGAEEISGPVGPNASNLTIKSRKDLTEDFVKSVEACRAGARRKRWARALRVLEADPLFEEANVSFVADEQLADWEEQARTLFKRLSSGHSVVLLTITKLVELVEEKSLVLIDEPEGHLHPPLLSAFVRALSDLLIDRNGVAIIATHSPVVLQEVPKHCVWILSRAGHLARVDRPELETFGENAGVLTREVFGLEVVQTGFHKMISEAASGRNYDEVVGYFEGNLGAEARGLARMLTMLPPTNDDDEDLQ